MARRKRRKSKEKIVMMSIMVIIIAMLAISGLEKYRKELTYRRQEENLIKAIEEEKARSEEIESLGEFIKTDEYVEQVAKDKLGLVNPNETIFKSEEP